MSIPKNVQSNSSQSLLKKKTIILAAPPEFITGPILTILGFK